MTLLIIVAIVSTAFVAVGTGYYIERVARDKIQPVLASWIIMGTTNSLSFATYWTTKDHNFVANVTNATGAGSGALILLAVYIAHRVRGGTLKFSPFQKRSLGISGAIFVFWIVLVWGFGKTGLVPFLLTQVLMLIGYIVTAEKLRFAEKSSEPVFAWSCITIACLIGFYPAIVKRDPLALLYSTRATLSAAALVALIVRIKRKNRGSRQGGDDARGVSA